MLAFGPQLDADRNLGSGRNAPELLTLMVIPLWQRIEAMSPVDRYSYCRGLEIAAEICEKPAKPLKGEIEPAAMVHARIIRDLIQAYESDDSAQLK